MAQMGPRSDVFGPAALARHLDPLGRRWWLFLLSGIAWVVVAVIVLRFDYTSVVAVAVLFGIFAITIGSFEFSLAMVTRGWLGFFRALFGVIFIAAGVVAFFTPGDTFVGLAAVISFYFVFAGVWDIASAFSMRHVSGWWVQLVSGLLWLGLGFWAAGSWDVSASLLVGVVAAIALIRGIAQISLSFALRSVHEAAKPA